MGAVGPSFRPVYECLSSRYTAEAKPRGTVSLGKDQWTSGQPRILPELPSLHPLFYLIILMILLAVFSAILSVTHATDVIIPINPIFFLEYFSLKFFGS